MDVLEFLGLGRYFFPRLTAIVVGLALVFATHFSAGLVVRAAEDRARQITKMFDSALRSTLNHSPHHNHSRRH